ncbi:hypothetical protein [Flavobacterium hydrophilum]|uniref:Uncharacterized protein n=1 Tax=Flavobacterium hydrophilum TaxID=2211445 RepID=A0A2V4C5D3_9FLAO|nr:hypothetical protein [Flavobacterium hydrophilum]PXY46549.1 hypothetical protein DMB68_05105 [Flavobacterium hydrophilum]
MDLKDLEKEKLKLEISIIKKAWYKKPEIWQAFLPTFIAIGSIIYALQSDIIGVKLQEAENKKQEVEIEKKELAFDTKVLKLEKERIKSENKKLKDSTLMLKTSLEITNEKIEIAQKLIEKLGKDSNEYNSIISKTKKDIHQLILIQARFNEDFKKQKSIKKRELVSYQNGKVDINFDSFKDNIVEKDLKDFEDSLKKIHYLLPIEERKKCEKWLSDKTLEYLHYKLDAFKSST